MGNTESASNDLEDFGNQLVNGVVDTGYQIVDVGTTAINETTNVINEATTVITDTIVLPIVNEIDPSQKEIIRQQTRKPIKPPYVKPPPKPPRRFDIKKRCCKSN